MTEVDLSFLVSSEAIIIYCSVIIGIAVRYFFSFRSSISPIIKELEKAIDRINKTERSKEAFPEDYYDFKDWMEDTVFLKDSWREFEETLLIPDEDFDNDKQIILNTHLTSVHFNQKNILWHNVNMRFYNALPNMLTGLGIIGTFLGLAIGIYIAAPGLNSESIDDAKDALNQLLSGASLAFITSIAGLLSSLIFSFLEKQGIHKFNQSCQKLVGEIDARVEYFSAERLASKSLNEFQKQSLALESFANDLAVSLGQVIEQQVSRPMIAAINELKEGQKSANDETLKKLISEFSTSISGAAGEEMKAFANTLDSMSTNLESQISAITQNQAEMQAASKQAVTDMATAMTEGGKLIKEEIHGAVAALSEGIAKSLDAISEKLESTTMKLSEKLAASIAGFDDVIDRISEITQRHELISQSTSTLHQQLNESIKKAKESVSLAGEVNAAFNATVHELTSFTENVSHSSTSVKESTLQIAASIEKIESMHGSIKLHWDEYSERFAAVDTSLSNAISTLRDGLDGYASSTNEYVVGLDKHAAQVVQDLASAVQEVNDVMESISDTLESQKIAFLDSISSISNKALTDTKLVSAQPEQE